MLVVFPFSSQHCEAVAKLCSTKIIVSKHRMNSTEANFMGSSAGGGAGGCLLERKHHAGGAGILQGCPWMLLA